MKRPVYFPCLNSNPGSFRRSLVTILTTVEKSEGEQGSLAYFQYDFNPTNVGRSKRLISAPKVQSGSGADPSSYSMD
jgi:hypothetical protein